MTDTLFRRTEIVMPAEIELAEHAAVIRALGKRVIGDVIEIGKRLTECRRVTGHGDWLPWLDREFGWTEQTALNFMRVHEMAKSKTVLDLDLPIKSLYLLAAPSTPAEARDAIIDRSANGETLTHGQVQEIVDKAVATATERQIADTNNAIAEREAEVRAEFDGKLIVAPETLQAEIDKVVLPLRKKIEDYETKLATIKQRERDRIERDRQRRSKKAGTKKSVGIDSQASLNETAFRSTLRDFLAATMKISPDGVLKIAAQSAKATEQTLVQWLGESPAEARAAIAWLKKYLTLCDAAKKRGERS